MIYLVTAVHCEARPLIEHYGLKRADEYRPFQVFAGEGVALIITGMGKMKSAVATASLLARGNGGSEDLAVNIGICGSKNREVKLATPILVHQIIDGETDERFFPDLLFDHRLPEGSLETHHRIIRQEDIGRLRADFVDMEASGFYQACQPYLAPHQIHVIKVVSDYLEPEGLHKDFILSCISKNLKSIGEFIEAAAAFCKSGQEPLSEEEKGRLDALKEHLRLTVTQTHQLFRLARNYKIRTGRSLPSFDELMESRVRVKEERQRAYDRLQSLLSGE